MKKILILSLITALLCMSACGQKAVEQAESMVQKTEQSVEQESSVTVQDKTERMEATENPDEGSSEPGSPETMEPEEQEADGVSGENAAVSTPKPAEANAPLPTATPQPTAVVSAVPTPEPHTSCTWDGGTVSTAAGCNSEGVKTFTCTVCGNTKTESIAAAGHSYTTDSKAATCTEPGYTKTYCTTCGDVQSETVQPATGHTMAEEWIDDQWYHAATCTSDGTGHFNSCINCKYAENLPWPALGHEPDAGTVYRAGTCTRPAKITHKCTRCGCDLEDTVGAIDPNNHDWAIDPEDGVEYCAECGLVE